MREHKITDKENGAEYLMFSATDVEFVNPIDYYSGSAKKLGFSLARDFFAMSAPEFPSWIIEKFAHQQAENFWKEQYAEIIKTEVPKQWIDLLSTQSKKEQVSLLKGLTINPDQLIALIVKAWTDHGYTFSQYVGRHSQKGLDESQMPKVTYVKDGIVSKVGETKLTDGQLKQAIEHKTVTISKFFDKGTTWHCLFVTHKSLRGDENWKGGQPHYHYISDKFGIPRDKAVAELKSRDYHLNSLPHIDLLDYGSGEE